VANASVFLKNKTRGIETYQEKKNREPIKNNKKRAQDNLGRFENA
jgi:hypothetical protein